ncbi:hypothetical protein [Burkholderia pseudomallei]|uniref:hypothetical protein n=1 Tax=Burkholderia pseudomallei TaxID=28450 RepID=UPI001F5B0682|nr:hypothetical protein [Burkholderia pseudomallei]
MKKIAGDAACRRAADVTRIARTSSPACRSRCFATPTRVRPPRTASAARTIRAARRRRHAPGVDARRGIVGAIGAHRHARPAVRHRACVAPPATRRRAAANVEQIAGASFTASASGRCSAPGHARIPLSKECPPGDGAPKRCRCTNGSGYLDDLDDSDEMRERVAMAQCPPHVMPPRRLSQTSVFGGASDSSLSEAAPLPRAARGS